MSKAGGILINLHARQQAIAMVDTDTGELVEKTLEHDRDGVRRGAHRDARFGASRLSPKVLVCGEEFHSSTVPSLELSIVYNSLRKRRDESSAKCSSSGIAIA
jgi:hypothetical protein